MANFPAGCVDLILTDLPYGTTACAWDTIIPFADLWKEWKRVCKPNAAIVLFGSQPFTSQLINSNPKWFRYGWVWQKDRISNFQLAKKQPLKCHEDILVFSQGQTVYNPQGLVKLDTPKLVKNNDSSRNLRHMASGKLRDHYTQEWTGYPKSILSFPTERGLHPTQKPVALLEYLIRTYTNEGDTVLDCTMGSGSTIVAAINTGRAAIGIERDEHYFDIAVSRAEKALQGEQYEPISKPKILETPTFPYTEPLFC